VWISKIAYNEAYARFSPGALQFMEMTRTLGDDKTIRLGDSVADPDHPMINTIWRERMAIHDLLISTTPHLLQFKLIASFERNRRKLRQVAKTIYHRIKKIRDNKHPKNNNSR
jgi:hypothetical protein